MDCSKRTLWVAGIALLALTGAPAASAQQWKPTKPITIIVPWAAGGSTDQVTRVTASEIEKALGQKVVIVNQPGASGSIGTKNALEAPKDGYTWTAGAAMVTERTAAAPAASQLRLLRSMTLLLALRCGWAVIVRRWARSARRRSVPPGVNRLVN